MAFRKKIPTWQNDVRYYLSLICRTFKNSNYSSVVSQHSRENLTTLSIHTAEIMTNWPPDVAVNWVVTSGLMPAMCIPVGLLITKHPANHVLLTVHAAGISESSSPRPSARTGFRNIIQNERILSVNRTEPDKDTMRNLIIIYTGYCVYTSKQLR